jgi:hypothetical protein
MILKVAEVPLLRAVGAVAFVAVLAACGSDNGAGTDTNAAPDSSAFALIQGTPPGGLEDWVNEIVSGIAGLASAAETDAVAAQRRALDLYVGRQEYIEMYWGPQGRLKPDSGAAELGDAVLEAETKFHDVLQVLAAARLDTAKLRTDLTELDARLSRVLAQARQSHAVLIPPGNPPAGIERSPEH